MRITPDTELCERRAKYLRDRNPLPLLRQRVQRLFTEAFHFQWRSDPGSKWLRFLSLLSQTKVVLEKADRQFRDCKINGFRKRRREGFWNALGVLSLVALMLSTCP
jgi:hypothetical protein